ncbi:MAG: UDP-N-acetylglucosamine--N-acetylmuramyl-(pentapeptide) pyrophosphoryl-undecaprenol N-acetylglucosamine transferase, partial [Rhodospirillaceae bacterium]
MTLSASSRGVQERPIVLAAGGTGGHVFPAEALAEELRCRGHSLVLVTDRRGGLWRGALAGIPVHAVSAGGLAGRGLGGFVKGAARLAWGVGEALWLLRRLRPKVVVGFGGYASVPSVVAAVLAGSPTLVHEQNAVLGRANRLLAPWVDRVAVSFARTTHARGEGLQYTGMPVRAPVQAVRDLPYEAPRRGETVRLLILGGSQGAHVFGAVVPAALNALPAPLRARLKVSQQVRPEDLESVAAAYAESGVMVELKTFFDDVPARLAEAHLVIARAGASTVAELTVAGRPVLLVPYPHAIDDHQTANAHAVAEAGGAWLIPQETFTPEALAARLQALLLDLPAMLAKSAACARATARPDAARRLA